MPNDEPADDATGPTCSWCATDLRPAAFCSAACEAASYEANECFCLRCDRSIDPDVGCLNGVCVSDDEAERDSEQYHRSSNHGACLAYISRVGL